MAVTTKFFPFVMGLDQTTDNRLLEPGRPRAIENLAIRKKGRLGMRYDYDSLVMTTSESNFRLYDLHNYNGRLLALTQFDGQDDTATTNYIQAVHQYTGVAVNAWIRLSQPALPVAARARNIGFLGMQVQSTTQMDVAAGNGLVGMIWLEDLAGTGSGTAQCLFFKAATGERIGTPFTVFSGGFNNRVRIIFINGKFFMAAIDTTNKAVKLTSYDPVTDTRTLLTDPLAAQANVVNCLDMSLSNEGTTFWMAFGLAGPTITVKGFDNTGTQTYTTAGPAVLADALTIFAEATNGTNRVNLLILRNGTNQIDAHTYVPPAGAPALSTVNIFTPDTTTRQPVMCIRTSNNNHVMVAYQLGNNIQQRAFNDTTHALIAAADFQLFDSQLQSKLMNIRGQRFASITDIRAIVPLTLTNMLYQFTNLTVTGATDGRARPACFGEVGFASAQIAAHLPHVAFDISTALSYWGRCYVSEFIGGSGFKPLPLVSELALVETARRQSVQQGANLYLAGGVTMSIDGVAAAESGGFLVSPRMSNISTSGVGGSIPTGTYQLVAVYETFDSQRQRIQSIPSAVATAGPLGGTGTSSITLSVSLPHTFWDGNFLSSARGPSAGKPLVVFYRTLANEGGNLTFYREKSVSVITASGGLVTTTLTADNATLQLGEILYTQGSRGALSGPLPFEVASPSVSLAASADRLLSGGLPETSSIQESRPLFPAEPIQWSNGIGFFRDARGDVLAVARLDERRILWTANEMFEADGEGVDDNGNGTIGPPRRLPSDVGLFGGLLGWRSIVECSLGIMFQGQVDLIYLLPRGGTTPQPIGVAVQDLLASFPSITAAVYLPADQTVRFTCNNSATAPTDSLFLLYDLTQKEWVTEGPFGAVTAAAVQYQGRMTTLQTNVVKQQRTSHPPAALITNAWRSGTIHPFGLGQFGRVLSYQFYGEYRGDCSLKCIATYDDLTVETMRIAEVNAITIPDSPTTQNATAFFGLFGPTTLAVGNPFSEKFTPNQMKCECVRVDFEVDIPFPNIIAGLSTQTGAGLKVNTINITLSALRATGDRMVVVFMQASSVANAPTSAGWTQRNSATTGFSRTTTMERIFDGTEVTPVTFNWTGNACATYVVGWLIRNSHPSSAVEVFATGTGVTPATTLGTAAFTPSWGLNENTLYLSLISLDTVQSLALSGTPASTASFRQRVQVAGAVNADPEIDGLLAGTDRATRPVAFTATWSWPALSTAVAPLIAVRPNAAIPSEGLAYHYWAMDVEDAGKSALKSPLQMG